MCVFETKPHQAVKNMDEISPAVDVTFHNSESDGSEKSNENQSSGTGKDVEEKKLKPPFVGFGIMLGILAAFLTSFQSLCVKLITSIDAIQITASRCGVQLLLVLPFVTYDCWRNKTSITGPPGTFKLLVTRGVAGSTFAVLIHQALVRIPAGDAVTISFSNMIFTMIFGYMCLGEALTLVDGGLCLLTLVGVVLLTKPPFLVGKTTIDTEALLGIFFSLTAALLMSVTYIVLRKLTNTPALLNIVYYSFLGSVNTSILTYALGAFRYPCWIDILWLFVMASNGTLAQLAMTVGLKYERAASFAVIRSFQIVIIFVLQVIVLREIPDTLSIIGSTVIFCAVLVIGIRKVFNQRRARQKNQ